MLQRAAFSPDRFHPGKKGCEDWAGWVVNGMAHRLEEFAESAVPLGQQ
jgi:hypothetical protein